jgi:hypothetical protein
MNKRDPIYQNHGELVVGVDHLLLSLTFRQPNYGLADDFLQAFDLCNSFHPEPLKITR